MAKASRQHTEKTPAKVQESKVKSTEATEVKAYGNSVRDNHDKVFAAAMKLEAPTARAVHLLDNGITSLTIKQTAALTGLNAFTVRQKTQSKKLEDGSRKPAIWTKDYDEHGRVLIPVSEIVNYLTTGRSTRSERMYKVFLNAEQAKAIAASHPGCRIRLANLSKAEKEGKVAASVGPAATS